MTGANVTLENYAFGGYKVKSGCRSLTHKLCVCVVVWCLCVCVCVCVYSHTVPPAQVIAL